MNVIPVETFTAYRILEESIKSTIIAEEFNNPFPLPGIFSMRGS
jgi:hypothetical protein